jgi:hypothetical protein
LGLRRRLRQRGQCGRRIPREAGARNAAPHGKTCKPGNALGRWAGCVQGFVVACSAGWPSALSVCPPRAARPQINQISITPSANGALVSPQWQSLPVRKRRVRHEAPRAVASAWRAPWTAATPAPQCARAPRPAGSRAPSGPAAPPGCTCRRRASRAPWRCGCRCSPLLLGGRRPNQTVVERAWRSRFATAAPPTPVASAADRLEVAR